MNFFDNIKTFITKKIKGLQRENRVFIVPTKYGFYFLFIVFILFIISLTYGHSLAFVTTFLFVSMFVVSAFFTNYTLYNVKVESLHLEENFHEGQEGYLKVKVKNISDNTSYDVDIIINEFQVEKLVNLPSQEYDYGVIPLLGLKRGKYSVSEVTVRSEFPFGLFRAWKYQKIKYNFVVYPEILSNPSMQELNKLGESSKGDYGKGSERGAEEFDGHKSYQEGMPLRGIDWKAYARGRDLLIKNFVNNKNVFYAIDLDKIGGSLEEKIKLVTSWIHHLDGDGEVWSLSIDGKVSEIGQGKDFQAECFRRLAVFNSKEVVW